MARRGLTLIVVASTFFGIALSAIASWHAPVDLASGDPQPGAESPYSPHLETDPGGQSVALWSTVPHRDDPLHAQHRQAADL
jgi:hypothetical protein